MKSLLIALLALGSLEIAAQTDDRSARGGEHNVSAVTSFSEYGFNFGAAYEYMMEDSLGFIGHLRFFDKDDDAEGGYHDGIMIFGAGVGHHFYKKSWDLSFSPTFNIINIDDAPNGIGGRAEDDETTFGPGLSIALLTQLTPNVALGFDWSNYWVWFDDVYAGKRIDDLGVKVRVSF